MKFLLIRQQDDEFDLYFPEALLQRLRQCGELVVNPFDRPYRLEELMEALHDVDVCITQWGGPALTEDVLREAGKLKLIAHAAGSVTHVVTDAVYDRGIRVSSANAAMSKYVAEGALVYMLSGLRLVPQLNQAMKSQALWTRRIEECKSLFEAKVGLVGLGATGYALLPLLAPFQVTVKVYDPYLREDALDAFPFAQQAGLEETLRWAEVVSVHAALTPETFHLMDEEKLSWMQDDALLVNTARGAIVDEMALVDALRAGRLRAVLDVFAQEPLPLESPLRTLDNAILLPHAASTCCRAQMFEMTVGEIEGFVQDGTLRQEVSHARYLGMTRESSVKR